MKEVAERTGVSVSTVSLVLNDRDEGRVKPAIAEQVRATAKRLGYRPNPLARSLRTSKTRILGFISEGIAAMPYAGGIILGAQDAASKLGYMLRVKGQNVCLARRVAGVRFGLFECRLSGCSRCR